MDYLELKSKISEIAEMASGVPDAFQTRCFEILLQNFLQSLEHPTPAKPKRNVADGGSEHDLKEGEKNPKNPAHTSLPLQSQMKVFMQRTGVSQDDLQKLVLVEEGEVHFIREPQTKVVSRGQIEWSLLCALKNGILNNNLSVEPETVRSICQEKGFYDQANFIKNFKSSKTSAFFSGAMETQGEPRKLTTQGMDELAKIIKTLTNS